jgi:ElaB/YqjD/DUF883 family membrane-anchored ribosome-binding protein
MDEPTTAPRRTRSSKAASQPGAAKRAPAQPEAKQRFAKALEEAKAGVQALGKEAQDRAGTYREKVAGTSSEWAEEAKAMSEQARDKAFILASEGKSKASEAISSLGKLVEDNATTIDEKVGQKYGDYARTAAKGMQDAAAKLDSKEIAELGEDAKEFVRKSPGVAVAIAAAAGFVLARIFKRSGD